MINLKIGSIPSADYQDWNALWLGLIAAGSWTQDYECEQVADVNNTTADPGGAIGFHQNGHSLHIFNGNPPLGNQNNGFKTFVDQPVTIDPISTNLGDLIIIDGLNIINRLSHSWCLDTTYDKNGENVGNHDVIIKNCICQGTGTDQNGTWEYGIKVHPGNNGTKTIFNCKVFNCASSGILIYAGGTPSAHVIENCSVYNCAKVFSTAGFIYSGGTLRNSTIRNNVVVNNFNAYPCWQTFPSGLSNVTINNNASSDATAPTNYGTGNLFNIQNADFLSIDSSSNNFLNIDVSSTLYNRGSTSISSLNISDIAENPRPHGVNNLVSIGTYEGINAIPSIDYYTYQHVGVFLKGLLQSFTTTVANRIPILQTLMTHMANFNNPHKVTAEQIGQPGYIYWGYSTVDGSYRTYINGNDLVTERRESGIWVEKNRILA
jgi:hypothetical protein